MKNLIFSILLMASQLLSFAGPDNFEGNINFAIDLEGTGTDILKAMLPNSYVYTIKGDQMVFKMEGGMTGGMLGEVVINSNDGNHYVVKHSDKKAFKMDAEEVKEKGQEQIDAKVEVLDEYETILGYKCRKYKIITTQKGEEIVQFLWATPDIELGMQENVNSQLSGNIFYENVKGFPLKVETDITKMGMEFKMIMTATSVQKESVSKDAFSVPSGYQIEPFEPSKMMGF